MREFFVILQLIVGYLMAFAIRNIWYLRLFATLLGLNADALKAGWGCLDLFSCCPDLLRELLRTISTATNPVMVLLGGEIGMNSATALSR